MEHLGDRLHTGMLQGAQNQPVLDHPEAGAGIAYRTPKLGRLGNRETLVTRDDDDLGSAKRTFEFTDDLFLP